MWITAPTEADRYCIIFSLVMSNTHKGDVSTVNSLICHSCRSLVSWWSIVWLDLSKWYTYVFILFSIPCMCVSFSNINVHVWNVCSSMYSSEQLHTNSRIKFCYICGVGTSKKDAIDWGSLLVIKVYLILNWTAVQSYKYKYPLNFSLWSQLIPSYEATF